MAQPEPLKYHVEIDIKPARRVIKRAIRDLEEANRLMAQLEARCAMLEEQLAAEYGIDYVKEAP